ncbi:hypothetical protein QE152_g9573 [Popillia japonica]|uniref:Uncharacterized protein n=1 Tax=Popillia japonica TaxID=7064 RepID=A0AAW1LXT4_POPJA
MCVASYLQEDAYRDRYQRKWTRSHQPSPSVAIRDSRNGDVVWQCEDDFIGTVFLATFSRESSTLEEMAHLPTLFGVHGVDGGGLVAFYHSFDKDTFESTVLPTSPAPIIPTTPSLTTPWN